MQMWVPAVQRIAGLRSSEKRPLPPKHRRYKVLLLTLAASYSIEPLLSQVYIRTACAAGEAVQAGLRREAFRTLLMQRIRFFDTHRCGLCCEELMWMCGGLIEVS